MKWILIIIGAVLLLGLIGNIIDPAGSRAVFRDPNTLADAEVLVTRDSNELRFTNDGPDDLKDCDVTIEGNYGAVLPALPVREQKFLVRAQFKPEVPPGEFYQRALRSTRVECHDANGKPQQIKLK